MIYPLPEKKKKNLIYRFWKALKRDWQLYLIILIPVVYTLIFNYGPMYGIQIAFKKFSPRLGIIGSPWVGLKWFKQFLSQPQFLTVFLNTLLLSCYGLFICFPIPVFFALIVNTIRNKHLKKTVQTISYMPHFISVTVAVSILLMVLSPINGLYGNLYRAFGGFGDPTDFRYSSVAFRHLYIWSGVWQHLGWDSIIYLAALTSVPQELHEAAQLDGASRFKRILYVDIPAILPQICILLILRCGSLVSIGFEKVYLMQAPGGQNLETAEVISTYMYKVGFRSWSSFSYGSAIGLFNSIINIASLLTVNFISKKLSDNEISLF